MMKKTAVKLEGQRGHKLKFGCDWRWKVGVFICPGRRRCILTQRRDAVAWTGTRRCEPGGGSNASCEQFLVLTEEPWLREEWKDIHDWFAGRLARKTWRESLARFTLNNMAVETAKEGFLHGNTHISMRLYVILAKCVQLCHRHASIFTRDKIRVLTGAFPKCPLFWKGVNPR